MAEGPGRRGRAARAAGFAGDQPAGPWGHSTSMARLILPAMPGWDEGDSGGGPIGMIVLSPKGKGGGYSNTIAYDHSSTLRTVQEIFGVTPLGRAATATDLRDLFVSFP